MISNLLKQCLQIRHYDPNVRNALRVYWQHHHRTRQEFIKELRKDNIKGKEYSSAVAEWDRNNRPALIDKMRNV